MPIRKFKFSEIGCGDWFKAVDGPITPFCIRCEDFTDASDEPWNSIDLRHGTLFNYDNDDLVYRIQKPIRFHRG